MLDADRLLRYKLAPVEQHVTPRDVMLYALGIGIGDDPLDPGQLRFVYEENLQMAPTMAITLCYPDMLIPLVDAGVEITRLLHAKQSLSIVKPLPVDAVFVGHTEFLDVIDFGAGKDARIIYRNRIYEKSSGDLVAELNGESVSLGGGGFGGSKGVKPVKIEMPNSEPTVVSEYTTLRQQALLYRLSGDYNPFHVDSALASAGGFKQPILHGRCTFGIVAHAILRNSCGYQGARLRSMQARMAASVYPGETIRTEIWNEGTQVRFRASIPARNTVVIDQGLAVIGD
ncbi:MAG: MaoC/PaaZ C-terminal domain-containing protein [Janthinobacterium lividum]